MILDPDAGHHGSRIPPEHRVITSVITRAMLDLFSKGMLTSHPDEAVVVRCDAMLFNSRNWALGATTSRAVCCCRSVSR
jgi:hypothetical protein